MRDLESVEGTAEEERCTDFPGAGEVRACGSPAGEVRAAPVARLGVGDGVVLARRHGRSGMRFTHLKLDAGGRPATDGARVPWRGLERALLS